MTYNIAPDSSTREYYKLPQLNKRSVEPVASEKKVALTVKRGVSNSIRILFMVCALLVIINLFSKLN